MVVVLAGTARPRSEMDLWYSGHLIGGWFRKEKPLTKEPVDSSYNSQT